MPSLQDHAGCLRHLTRTDADPRVRHRADALVLVAEGLIIRHAARFLGMSPDRIRILRDRFLAHGRDCMGQTSL